MIKLLSTIHFKGVNTLQINYKPSKWSKLPYLSKLGLVLFYLSALCGCSFLGEK
jgi:hypothetical protein